MNKELREAMIGILEDLVADPTRVWSHSYGDQATHFAAGLVLNRAGHLSSFQGAPPGSYITLSGFGYLEELKHPIRSWLARNWFAVVVAVTTGVVSAVSAGAQAFLAFGP